MASHRNGYYADDEDVALRASADFLLLCPKDQRLAWGNDGSFAASDRWTLNSASTDFLQSGLEPGCVMHLSAPVNVFRAPGELFVISAVSPSQVRLRRKGQPDGVGQPPGTVSGVSQVEFSVITFGPQIRIAGADLNHLFGISEHEVGRRPVDLMDPAQLRDPVILTVLYRQYLDLIRGASSGSDSFTVKAQLIKQELDDRLARTVVRWRNFFGSRAVSPQPSRFSTRLSR